MQHRSGDSINYSIALANFGVGSSAFAATGLNGSSYRQPGRFKVSRKFSTFWLTFFLIPPAPLLIVGPDSSSIRSIIGWKLTGQ